MKIKIALMIGFSFVASLINGDIYLGESCFTLRSDVYAQNTKYSFKKYTDRQEGVIKKEQLVAGERLLLISAAIENNEPLPAENILSYNLKFYLQDTARVNIEVWEFEKSYKMTPFLKSYPAGLATFSWPSEILQYYKITLKDLFPLAKTSDAVRPTYLPIAFYYANPELRGQYYSFSFVPLKSITTLEYKFYKAQSINPIHSGKLRAIKKDQKIFIQWNGRNQNNQMADSGLFTLMITATYTPKPGTRPMPPVTTQYQFSHYLELLKR